MSSRNDKKNRSATRSGGSGSSQRPPRADGDAPRRPALRTSTDTKVSRRTTELAVYVALVLAVVMVALAVDADGRGGEDPFGAQEALRYITVLTIGYMLARGIAKAGSRQQTSVPRRHADDGLSHEPTGSHKPAGRDEPVGPDEPVASDEHSGVDEPAGPARPTDATVDDTSYLLPAPDGHTHQDGHAHVPGHPHDDGHVHGEAVSHRG